MSDAAFESLDDLARQLPFHLDDVESVNACYVRFREDGKEEDRQAIELWIYCFIRRYFVVKFIQEPTFGTADFDVLVEATFEKVDRFAPQIQQPGRFASWVSVICKNTYLNYLRRRKRSVPILGDSATQLVADQSVPYGDPASARLAVVRAIQRLPVYLQECVQLRFLDGLTYEEISERTGYPLPRIRSYINKAVKRFREDSELLDHLVQEE